MIEPLFPVHAIHSTVMQGAQKQMIIHRPLPVMPSRPDKLHPVQAVAAIFVIVVSMTGMAFLTGLLPMNAPSDRWLMQTRNPDEVPKAVASVSLESDDEEGSSAGGTTAGSAPSTPRAGPSGSDSVSAAQDVPTDMTKQSPPVTVLELPLKTTGLETVLLPVAHAAPAVFIHVRSRLAASKMSRLEAMLAFQKLRLAGVKVVMTGPRASDIRYFRDDEHAEAIKVQAALLSIGLPVKRLKHITGFEKTATIRQYEVWLADDLAIAD